MARAERGLHGEAARVADRVRGVLGAPTPAEGGRRGVRLDPGRRPVLVVGLVVALAAVLTGMWVLSSGPKTMPVSAAAPGLGSASPLVPPGSASPRPSGTASGFGSASGPGSGSAAARPAVVVVDVAGKVARPGVYRLPSGSRIDDALRAAGGAQRGVDLTSLNLASVVLDGQQIAVGRPGAAAAPGVPPAASGGAGSAGGGASAGGLVNLNTATLGQLDDLPGIGPALSQRILDYRTEHGSFTVVDQLDDVSGIGPSIFAKLKSLVTV